MPLLGKNTFRTNRLPIPHTVLKEAISVSDIPAQERFRKAGPEIRMLLSEARETDKITRLFNLWQQALQFRLIGSAEEAKIALSGKPLASVSLDYLDSELEIPVSQQDLLESIDNHLGRIGQLAREAVTAASAPIDKIFLTGGASRSPAVIQRIRQELGLDVPVLRGDDFGAVTMGLTRYARHAFA